MAPRRRRDEHAERRSLPAAEEVAAALGPADDAAADLGDEVAHLRARRICRLPVQPCLAARERERARRADDRDDRVRVAFGLDLPDLHTRHVHAAILTIGNEIVSGDTENTNASWLSRRLEELGVKVVLSIAIPDELDLIVEFVRREAARVEHLIVTGGLGGTPDDITREALAAAFEVPQEIVPELADDLRSRFTGDPEYARAGPSCPRGSRPLENPRGGAPGFRIENAWVLPGLPAEMKAMFDRYADELRAARPIGSWRRRYALARVDDHARARRAATTRWPDVLVGSYPASRPRGPSVEVVLKSSDPDPARGGHGLPGERARPPHLIATLGRWPRLPSPRPTSPT